MQVRPFISLGLRAVVLGAFVLGAACAPSPSPTPTPQPSAGAVLQYILTKCWGLTQIKDLDGANLDQVNAFKTCAQPLLLAMAQDYPNAAEPHRVLAWGDLYALKLQAVAEAEYQRAAEIYAQQGQTAEQADMIVRQALLVLNYDRRRGCLLLSQAAGLDPQNTQAPQLIQNFGCAPAIATPPGPGGGASTPPIVGLPTATSAAP